MQKSIGTILAEVALVTGVLVSVILGLWFLSPQKQQTPAAIVKEKTESAGTSALVATGDADNDTLPDWEEVLWGTDPKHPDTDGDGTTDGEEVVLGRNPKKSGPDDSLETPIILLQKKETDMSLVQRQRTALPPAQMAGREEVTPIGTTQIEDPLHRYGNAIGALIQWATAEADAELAFWNKAAGHTQMTENQLDGFRQLAAKYKRLSADISSLSAPDSAAPVHTNLVMAYAKYAEAIRIISDTAAGAYLSGDAVTAYGESAAALGRVFGDISALFRREGTLFGQSEPGAIFNFPR
ncbi:MAG: hypothetical protein Q7R88_00975 [bacterium]|nr:hypothetical protein [bacterium]